MTLNIDGVGGSRFPHSHVICNSNIGEGNFLQNIHEFTYELLLNEKKVEEVPF